MTLHVEELARVSQTEETQKNLHPLYCPFNKSNNQNSKCDSSELFDCIQRIDEATKNLSENIPIHPEYMLCQTYIEINQQQAS